MNDHRGRECDPTANGASTIRELLLHSRMELERSGSESPYLDAVILLGAAAGLPKERIYANLGETLSADTMTRYRDYVDRRVSGEPVAYILGRKEFFGLEFSVDPRVLVPRPETELLVETALAICREFVEAGVDHIRLHDTCTGSGCIPITLAHHFPALEVSASDVSSDALEVFRANSERLLGSVLRCFRSDLLLDVPCGFDIVTANPPYLTSEETRSAVRGGSREPPEALDGGTDGLDFYRTLSRQAADCLEPAGCLILECAPDQAGAISALCSDSGFSRTTVLRDLAGHDRVVVARKGA